VTWTGQRIDMHSKTGLETYGDFEKTTHLSYFDGTSGTGSSLREAIIEGP
jgi:hypothetical protein